MNDDPLYYAEIVVAFPETTVEALITGALGPTSGWKFNLDGPGNYLEMQPNARVLARIKAPRSAVVLLALKFRLVGSRPA